MMVFIFSEKPDISNYFKEISEHKSYETSFRKVDELKKIISKSPKGTLFYLDVSSISDSELPQILKYLKGRKEYHYGIIDTSNTIEDVGELFHNGTSDYIRQSELETGITVKRLKQLLDFKTFDFEHENKDDHEEAHIKFLKPSGIGWEGIKSGKEYTFTMLYIALDNQGSFKKELGDTHFNRISDNFSQHIEKFATPIGGRVWIWDDNSGILLFPFDGNNCDALIPAFRMVMNWRLAIVEGFQFNLPLSFRLVMHIGNTTYHKRGQTGAIISDSLNSIFHLGEQFSEEGTFYLTEEAAAFIPNGLKDCFAEVGTYEERKVFRMKTLI